MPQANTKPTQAEIADASAVEDRGFTTPCWVWRRTINPKGYGALSISGRTMPAHRLSFEAFHGPIPHGLVVDHVCRVRCCVNPTHLEVVTVSENNRRALPYRTKEPLKRASPAPRPKEEFCRRGHAYAEHGRLAPGGKIRCRVCDKLRETLRQQRRTRARQPAPAG